MQRQSNCTVASTGPEPDHLARINRILWSRPDQDRRTFLRSLFRHLGRVVHTENTLTKRQGHVEMSRKKTSPVWEYYIEKEGELAVIIIILLIINIFGKILYNDCLTLFTLLF
jgi:hypothetical protein